MEKKGTFGRTVQRQRKNKIRKFGDDNDFVNSEEDIGDALILSVNSQLNHGFWILVHLSIRLQARSCSKISNLEILEKYILLTIKP